MGWMIQRKLPRRSGYVLEGGRNVDLMLGLQRYGIVFLAGLVLALAPTSQASDEGDLAADEVSLTNYVDLMDNWLFTHDGDSRGPGGPDLVPCRDNIQALFESYGLSTALEAFTYSSATYHNVVATKVGTLYPDQEYVIGAHYDSVSNPGADDNASGVALVLEAARIISQYDSDYTIRFVAFSMEEVGLVGSEAYVSAHAGDDIQAMISADMVAYDNGTDVARVYGRPVSTTKATLGAAIDEYSGGLSWIDAGWISASNHAPFDGAGFDAALLIEGEVWNNPYYHTQQDSFDTPFYLDFVYAVRMTRSMVGWLVDHAGVQVPVDLLGFTYLDGRPEYVSPAGGTPMRVEVIGLGTEVPEPGTGMFHYDDGTGWQSAVMDVVAPNVYDAVFPAAACGQEILYYVSAESTSQSFYTDPRLAPAEAYLAVSAYGVVVAYEDDFDADQGWVPVNLGATSGDWQRGVPVNDPDWEYDPTSDSDGSGQCWLTQNEFGNTDVDDGAVQLTSPIIDMSGESVSITYDYFLRLTDSDGTDELLVEVSNNGNTGPWVEITSHTSDGALAWRTYTIVEADLLAVGVTPTANMKIRFTANDGDPQSIVEAGVDAFLVTTLDCTPESSADYDLDGDVDLSDFYRFQVCFSDEGVTYPGSLGCETFDFDGDEDVDLLDYNEVQGVFSGPLR
jgi:hypothetical protein